MMFSILSSFLFHIEAVHITQARLQHQVQPLDNGRQQALILTA